MPKVHKATHGFVFGTLGFLLLVHLFGLGIDPYRLIGYACWFVFETWALVHKGDGDTISEGFWSIATFPLIPWLCCFFFMHYTHTGVITHPHEIGALIAIQSHFFWQSWTVYQSFKANGNDSN